MKAKELIKMLKNYEDSNVYLNYKDNDNKLVEVVICENNIVLKTKLDEECLE